MTRWGRRPGAGALGCIPTCLPASQPQRTLYAYAHLPRKRGDQGRTLGYYPRSTSRVSQKPVIPILTSGMVSVISSVFTQKSTVYIPTVHAYT